MYTNRNTIPYKFCKFLFSRATAIAVASGREGKCLLPLNFGQEVNQRVLFFQYNAVTTAGPIVPDELGPSGKILSRE